MFTAGAINKTRLTYFHAFFCGLGGFLELPGLLQSLGEAEQRPKVILIPVLGGFLVVMNPLEILLQNGEAPTPLPIEYLREEELLLLCVRHFHGKFTAAYTALARLHGEF